MISIINYAEGNSYFYYKIKVMRKILLTIGLSLLTACSSIRFVDNWKNPEINSFNPKKLLVVGMTDNLTARKIFEEELKKSFQQRDINAVESTNVFGKNFTISKKSEKEIDKMIQEISHEGFDTVIITSVKGVNERISYPANYYAVGYRFSRFGHYYYAFQDVYYNPEYYESYKVYNVETAIYNICADETKSLVWVGALNLSNPQTISETVKDYVARIIKQLEYEKLIKKVKN